MQTRRAKQSLQRQAPHASPYSLRKSSTAVLDAEDSGPTRQTPRRPPAKRSKLSASKATVGSEHTGSIQHSEAAAEDDFTRRKVPQRARSARRRAGTNTAAASQGGQPSGPQALEEESTAAEQPEESAHPSNSEHLRSGSPGRELASDIPAGSQTCVAASQAASEAPAEPVQHQGALVEESPPEESVEPQRTSIAESQLGGSVEPQRITADAPPEGSVEPLESSTEETSGSDTSSLAAPATSTKRKEQNGRKATWRQPPRNVRLSYTRVNGKRIVKYRALLPLGNRLSPYRIGDFLHEEEAARAADRATLAFYGRDHPAAVTHFPKESYQEEKRVGKDLENFLTGLSPVSLPAPSAAHQQARAERPLPPPNILSSPIHAGATDTAGTHAVSEGPEHIVGGRTPQLRAVTEAGTAEHTEEPAGRASVSGRKALEAARLAAAARRQRRPEGDRARRAGLEALDARLRRLREEQRVAHLLDALAGTGEGQEWWYAAERRPRRMLEAEPPAEVDWNTKFTGRFADWARPGDSRFVTPHDYAADLRHAERCKAAGVPVVLKREDERLCTCCGSAHHTAKNCPSRVYAKECSEQQATAGKGKRGEEGIAEGPAWAAHMRPELTAVMRSLQQLSGAALGSPGMKPFRHLLGSFSPDALLALGLLTDEAMAADWRDAQPQGPMSEDTEDRDA